MNDPQPLVTLDLPSEARTWFHDCARYLLEMHEDGRCGDADKHREVAALVARLDAGEPIQTTPSIAWSVLDDALDTAVIGEGGLGEVTSTDEIELEEVERATARILGLAREVVRLGTLDVPVVAA